MSVPEHIPMVRCRLSGPDDADGSLVRYIPLAEFDLWRYLMETRHRRGVSIEEVSIWVSEQAAWWNSGYAPETLEPVLRVRFERPGPRGMLVPVERYFPAETYPRAQEALLAHYETEGPPRGVMATPGYFVGSERETRAANA